MEKQGNATKKILTCHRCEESFPEDMVIKGKIDPPLKYGDIQISKYNICPACDAEI